MAKALLVMDIQVGIVARLAEPEKLIKNISQSIKAAREKALKIIYITVEFRDGLPEISKNNKLFTAFASSGFFSDSRLTAIHADVMPVAGDIHIIKRRVSAFAGSDLDVVLRAQGIDELVLCGVSTSGVVLSTVREAADKDYKLTVLEDCCADADEEVHQVLMQKVYPRQAEVINHIEWIKTL